MRTTIGIDDNLYAKAVKPIGPLDRFAMVREGLRALVERESARRLARLGGTEAGRATDDCARQPGNSASRCRTRRHSEQLRQCHRQNEGAASPRRVTTPMPTFCALIFLG